MFDWERILVNNAPATFFLEVVFRSAVMFLALLIGLKVAGRRGVKQLSIFELVIVISLGSAAGDPMFYKDVGLLHALVVLIVVLALYRMLTWLTAKSTLFEKFLEGVTECLIDEGKISFQTFQRESLAQDEFFTELRLKNVDHLGQVKRAYLETSGDISVFFYEDEDVKPGLPILPELFNKHLSIITSSARHCCIQCGDIHELSPGKHACSTCQGTKWVLPIQTKRVT
ncbi:MAG: YetF domain-containing protein [Chryseolinea sp.]